MIRSFLVLTAAIALAADSLPANRESDNPDQKYGWTSFFYRSTDAGKTWTETPEIPSSPGNIQPTVQQLGDDSLLGFFRPRGRNAKLWRSTSHDGGETWAPLEPTTLDNPSTRSDFVALPNGKLVLACNVSPVNRTQILYGSNLGNGNNHDNHNLPVILDGGGFKHGQHLALTK